ncbi:MAG: PTS sugar transporter subunit IIA [Pirellulales bacterium]
MSEEDFDVAQLAAYLHLNPDKVQRLADRGKLPGRRLGGDWQFSRQEIHHWLENRIGLSDDADLIEVESILERSDTEPMPVISQMLKPEAVAVPFDARTRNSVVTRLCDLAATTGLLWDPPKMAEAVRAREQMHPTAVDNGVALLHPRRPLPSILGEAFIALGVTPQGIPFGADRGGLTDIFFLICSLDDTGHLRTLARLSRMVGDADFVSQLRAATSSDEALRLLTAREADLTD